MFEIQLGSSRTTDRSNRATAIRANTRVGKRRVVDASNDGYRFKRPNELLKNDDSGGHSASLSAPLHSFEREEGYLFASFQRDFRAHSRRQNTFKRRFFVRLQLERNDRRVVYIVVAATVN